MEMQTTVPAGLPNRLAYYLSSMYCEQLREGDSYAMLTPAICVCFMNRILFSKTSSFHTRFRLCSLEEKLVLTDHLEIHVLELPKYNGTIAELKMARPKERWAYFLQHATQMTIAEIGELLPEPAFVEAGGVLDMISKTPEERLHYELRVKAMRDQKSNVEAAREEGREKGREEGREEGKWLGQIQLLQQLLGDSVSTSDELGKWDLDRLKRTAESLQTRLRGRT